MEMNCNSLLVSADFQESAMGTCFYSWEAVVEESPDHGERNTRPDQMASRPSLERFEPLALSRMFAGSTLVL
jgi:hypothetical protein